MSRRLPPGIDRLPSGRLRARWRDSSGEPRGHVFAKGVGVREAVRWRNAEMAAAHTGTDLVRETPTVAEYAREWAASRPHRPTTARLVSSQIANHIEGTHLGGMRLRQVKPSTVQAWATERSATLSPSTLRQVVKLLRSIYASAVLDRLVATSPVVRVSLPSNERPRIVPLTGAQVRALADAVPLRIRAMVVAQAGLGLRVGELLALRPLDIDYLRRTVRVEWQFAANTTDLSAPKTGRGRRTIPLPTVVAEALAQHVEQFDLADDGSLFANTRGRRFSTQSYGAAFKRAVRALGLPEATSTHDLRHHYASELVARGHDVFTVAEWTGHTTPAEIVKTYGHMKPGGEAATRRAIDDVWSESVTEVSRGDVESV